MMKKETLRHLRYIIVTKIILMELNDFILTWNIKVLREWRIASFLKRYYFKNFISIASAFETKQHLYNIFSWFKFSSFVFESVVSVKSLLLPVFYKGNLFKFQHGMFELDHPENYLYLCSLPIYQIYIFYNLQNNLASNAFV